MAQNETFEIAGPAGRLEAILMRPEGDPVAVAVVCHAHPLRGGVMHFKVVFRAAKALQSQGLAALRFNFRGVGLSEGVHDEGRGEQDDVRATLDEAERRFPGLPLIVGGFSFGSTMALRVAARDARVRAVFALGVPVNMVTEGDVIPAITSRPVPRLFVQGDRDPFGRGDTLRALVADLAPPSQVSVIPESDHFFTGHLDLLQETIAVWASGRPWEAR